jgi:predicted PurR-regulated permease PerM
VRPATVPAADRGNRIWAIATTALRPVVLLAGVAFAVVVVAGLRAMSDLVTAVFLALVMTVTAYPLRGWLERRGLPSIVGSLAALAAVYAALVTLAAAIVVAAAQFAALLPGYQDDLNKLVNDVLSTLESVGIESQQIDQMRSSLDLGVVVAFAEDLLTGLAGVAGNLFFLVTVVFFMTFDASRFAAHLARLSGSRQFPQALAGFVRATRTYVLVSTVFGLIVAVLDMLALLWIGVPGVLLWGVLSFVTNYIPNIGFVLGVIPPATVALLEDGWRGLAAVLLVYSVINVVIQTIIQPRFVGDAVGLSPTVTMLSLAFWAWALGALGALLAVPLTLFVRSILLDADPRLGWVAPLVSGRADPENNSGQDTSTNGARRV